MRHTTCNIKNICHTLPRAILVSPMCFPPPLNGTKHHVARSKRHDQSPATSRSASTLHILQRPSPGSTKATPQRKSRRFDVVQQRHTGRVRGEEAFDQARKQGRNKVTRASHNRCIALHRYMFVARSNY